MINRNLVLYQLTSVPILYFLNWILVETANKMKFIIFAVVLCLTAYQIFAAKPKVTVSTWGRITNRVLDTKRVTESSIPLMVKTNTLKFPEVRRNDYKKLISTFRHWQKLFFLLIWQKTSVYQIIGIQHLDYKSHPVSLKFLKGGVGHYNVTLQIVSQRGHGINSTIIFYTQ